MKLEQKESGSASEEETERQEREKIEAKQQGERKQKSQEIFDTLARLEMLKETAMSTQERRNQAFWRRPLEPSLVSIVHTSRCLEHSLAPKHLFAP